MKNLLNLKGLCRSSQLALNPDGQTTVERRSNDGHSRRHLPVGLAKLLSLFLLTLGVGQMWGADGIGNISDVWLEGTMNSWSKKPANWKWTNDDGNHYTATFYIPYSSTNYQFKIRCAGSGWTEGSLFSGDGYWYTSSNTGEAGRWMKKSGAANDQIQCISDPTSHYIKLACEFWGAYGNNSYLKIEQSAVSALSPSLSCSPSGTSLNGGDTRTLSASCTGGSGGYNYSYVVTCGGADVTASTLSASSGASVTFTAPVAATEKTYIVTVTASDSHVLLSGLATKTATKTFTVAATVTPTIAWAASDPISSYSLVSGQNITLNVTRSNSSQNIIFYKKVGSGSWEKIADQASTTYTYTLPANTGATQTYYFKAALKDGSPYPETSASSAVSVYGKKTIHVRNTNDWATFKMHHWGDANPTSMPGNADNISEYGGQWKDVVILSSYTGFILNDGASSSGHQSYDLDYSTYSDDGFYEFATNSTYTGGAYKHALSSSSAPAAPTATTNDANEITSTTAKFNYSVNANRDKTIPGIAFKQSDDDIDAATIYSSGTKIPGSAILNGNASGSTAAQTITPGKKYYYVAYGTNGFGTSYGTVKSFVAPYKVTITKPTGCSAITPGTGTRYVHIGDEISSTAATGYTFSSWSLSEVTLSSPTTTEGVTRSTIMAAAENGTIAPVYMENMTTVALSATNGKIQYWDGDSWEDAASSVNVGVATNCSIKAVPATGYYFAGWVNTEGTDYEIIGSFNDEANTNTTLKGKGSGETTGQTLTANFVELDKIYFRNWNEDRSEPLWENVYAYFSISYEDNCAKSNSSSDYSGILMTREGTSNVYWVYVPRGTTRNNDDDIAFSNHNFGINYKFHNYEAVMRGDYKTEWNMFVPQHSNTSLKNSTTYYNGYWKHHNVAVGTDAGYRIERYNGSGYVDPVDNGDGSEHHRDFTVGSENTIIYQLRIDNLTSGYNNYRIYNEGGTHYITFGESVQETGYTLTNTDCSNIGLSEYNSGSPRFYITPTSEGTYTLTIDMSGDVMRLSVNYPVAKGDYQLIHSYNDGTAKVTRSDVIKTTDERQYSMYIDNTTAHSPSLVLKKCTEISDGNPVWSAGTSVDMSGFTANTKGVYVFDVAIAGDAATLKKIEPYRGNYYIKTDVAKGGWTSYTENAMEENTINATDFDYYYCKYIGSVDTNIKCVIANDYCNAVSDTLEGDDVIGAEVQTMPYAGSVRFSYNSATNELKRAYLNGSGDWERYFLELQAGSAVIKARNGSYFTNNKVKFTDNGNWIYHLELQAQEGARVKLVAHYYNGSTTINQYFKGADGGGSFDDAYTEELIGSTGESSWLGLSIIYDFKTNNLIAAWSPSGSIDATINLNTDVLLIHNRKVIKSAGDEVSMIDLTDTNGDGVYGDVKNINKVFSALRFLKESDGTYIGMTGTPANTAESYYRYNYWISFPYDVKMTDIFGISGYGSKWRIQYYDGEERADKGWYLGDGTTTFWKTMTMSDDTKLEKGRGYVLQLSPSAFQATGSGSLWELSDEIYLYFPSKAKFGNISRYTSSVTLSSLPCTKGLYTDGSGKNHNLTDSHWHVFGIPTFKNATGTTGTGDNYYDGEDAGTEQEAHTISGDPFYFYMYNNDGTTYNTYTVTSSSVSTFQPMHAYMIQMTGTLNFAINSVPASVAARQKKEIQNYDLRLELASEGQVADQTFVTLRENAVADFALNEDLTKIHNTGKANIYSYAGVYDVAANILPVENRTVVLGVETAKAGTYTFSMPDNFDGTVTLIDNFTQTRTNLALGDYEVSLPKGEMNDRFLLEINIRQVPTAIDGVEGGSLKDGKAHKFIENGAMYILRDGQIYDARGNKVK